MADISTKFEDLTAEQQIQIVDFMKKNFIPTKGINQKYSAYGLKQSFTRKYFYLTQEQFTQAMERAGFNVQPLNNGNACFNISARSPYFTHFE